jgi:uncharacterized membrane protein (UPF0127 family)
VGSRIATLRRSDGTLVCERCALAFSAPARMKGLLGRKSLPAGEGVLLRPAGSIQTMFMRFAIDAVFLDRDLRVLDVIPNLRPWRLAGRRGARAVLELPAGEASRRGIRPGERLMLGEEERHEPTER